MIEIIPAMDLIGGRCVRLRQGDYARATEYQADPIETAMRFEAAGLKRLHMVDLDGARAGTPANLNVLEKVADATSLAIDFSGGLRKAGDVRATFDAGASLVTIGSLAVKEPELVNEWIESFGADNVILGADCRDGSIAISGWQEGTDIRVEDHIKSFVPAGLQSAMVTDIGSDGEMLGPAIDLYRRLVPAFPDISIIASGGVSSVEDVDRLDAIGCGGVIVGKAIYEGAIALEELEKYAR